MQSCTMGTEKISLASATARENSIPSAKKTKLCPYATFRHHICNSQVEDSDKGYLARCSDCKVRRGGRPAGGAYTWVPDHTPKSHPLKLD